MATVQKTAFAFEVRFPNVLPRKEPIQGVIYYAYDGLGAYLCEKYPDCLDYCFREVPKGGIVFPLFPRS